MAAQNAEQDEAVLAVIVAFIRDAENMAELTATFLNHVGLRLEDGQSSWPAAFILELGAVLRIRQWEVAGIKDAIDPTLPGFQAAYSDLARRLQIEPDPFIRGEVPLLQRVLSSWWIHCAHPNEPVLNIDLVFSRMEPGQLLSCVAGLIWNLRNTDTPDTTS